MLYYKQYRHMPQPYADYTCYIKGVINMAKLINSLKKKKGFTLVEVIIVLVILAILAAILIPSLIGYIDKANEKASITECRNFVVAAQTIGSETYGEKGTISVENNQIIANGEKVDLIAEAFELSEVSPDTNNVQVKISAKGKITNVVFCDGAYTVTYDGKTYNAEPVNATKITSNTLKLS